MKILDWLSHRNQEQVQCSRDVPFTVTWEDQTWQCTLTERGASYVIEVNPPESFWNVSGWITIPTRLEKEYIDLHHQGEDLGLVLSIAKQEVSRFLQKHTTTYSSLQNESTGYNISQTGESCGSQSSSTNSDTPETNSQSQSQMKAETLSQSNIVVMIIMPGMSSTHTLKKETVKAEEGTATIQAPAPTSSEQDLQMDQSGSLKENSTQYSLDNMESMPLRQQVVLDLLLENFYQFCGPQEEFLMSALTGIVLDRMRKETSWPFTDPLAENRLEEYLSRRAKILEMYYQHYQTRPKESRN